jgi:site-specific DNA-methyltransferase (adenine-specific)
MSHAGRRKLNRIHVGDARTELSKLPAGSVDTVVTSPPYFRLRNYQHAEQIGLETTVDGWVDELLVVMRGVRRVLKDTGSLWLNLGDTYSRDVREGASAKSLVLAPERLALAMVRDGWILRNKVVWAKPNPMPTSVQDRLACTWETVYFFTKSRSYFFDLDAIRTPHRGQVAPAGPRRTRRSWSVPDDWRGPLSGSNGGLDRLKAAGISGHPLGKNPGDVWTIATAGYRGAHHAVYPTRLIERPLRASCPERTCSACGAPWLRPRTRTKDRLTGRLADLAASCECPGSEYRPGVVLDPFMGSGTTAIAAEALGRRWIGIELNEGFADLARERIARSAERLRPAA